MLTASIVVLTAPHHRNTCAGCIFDATSHRRTSRIESRSETIPRSVSRPTTYRAITVGDGIHASGIVVTPAADGRCVSTGGDEVAGVTDDDVRRRTTRATRGFQPQRRLVVDLKHQRLEIRGSQKVGCRVRAGVAGQQPSIRGVEARLAPVVGGELDVNNVYDAVVVDIARGIVHAAGHTRSGQRRRTSGSWQSQPHDQCRHQRETIGKNTQVHGTILLMAKRERQERTRQIELRRFFSCYLNRFELGLAELLHQRGHLEMDAAVLTLVVFQIIDDDHQFV